jgi:hypothetical protein
MSTLPAFPKSYTVEVVRSDGDRTTLYVDGWMRRLDIHPKTGEPTIVISRPDKGLIWSLAPQNRTYSRAKLPAGWNRVFDPDKLHDWNEDGTEMIDGRRHRRFVGRYSGTQSPIGKAREVCFIDATTGMRRRVDSYNKKGMLALRMDYLNAKVGRPPRTVFDMPAGYKRGYQRRRGIGGR